MKLKIKYSVNKSTAVGVIDSNRVRTKVSYKGVLIPLDKYGKIKDKILELEEIINQV